MENLAGHFVSIIVVNWNGRHFLKECLTSLNRQTYTHYEIILVDNGSNDSSVEFVHDNFPRVKTVQLVENKGFAGGNIKGMEVSKGDFIVLLNNDTRVDKQWLENLIQPMRGDSALGMCASKLIVEATGTIDSAGDCLTTWAVGFKRGFGQDPDSYFPEKNVFGACAAAALYRRTMLDDIGFLDEDFFFNDEDTDLNFRAQLGGWKCAYVPSAVVHHKVNATIGKLSDEHVYFHVRNLEFLWIKNMPTGLMIRFAHHKVLQEIGSFFYLCLRHRKWSAFFRGKRDALRMLPVMLKKRREVQSKKRVTNHYIQMMLMPIFNKELIRQKFQQFIFG